MPNYDLILKGGCVLNRSQDIDAAILSPDQGSFDYVDAKAKTLNGNKKLIFQCVVLGGKW